MHPTDKVFLKYQKELILTTLNKLGINENNLSKSDVLDDINNNEVIIGTNSAVLFEAALSRNNVFQIKEFSQHQFENVDIIGVEDLLLKIDKWNFDVVKANKIIKSLM